MSAARTLALLSLLWAGAAPAAERALSLDLPSGARIEARIIVPDQAAKPLPAIVLLGGLERGAQALDLLPHDGRALLVGFDYPLTIPDRIGWWRIPKLVHEIERGIDDTIAATVLLRERLMALPEVDPDRITIVGVSLGAPFAVIGGARGGYPGVALVHGFGDLPATIRHQFERRWRPKYGSLGVAGAWLAERAIAARVRLPVPERDAQRLSAAQKVFWVTASDDEFVPRSAVTSMREALRRSPASVTEASTDGRHVRGSDAGAVAELFALTMDWMRDEGLIDAQ